MWYARCAMGGEMKKKKLRKLLKWLRTNIKADAKMVTNDYYQHLDNREGLQADWVWYAEQITEALKK